MSDDERELVDATDQAIVRAIGEELRRARGSAGWSRPELIKRMKTPVPVNTYACYEQGIRACSIPRLVEICQAMDISVSELVGLALQRLEINLEQSGVQIDLQKILHDDRDELTLLRKWANNRLKADVTTGDPNTRTVVRLQWAVLNEVAIFCGVTRRELLNYIRDFTPESALR
jgi:transcriptional regulator with XRE-family HTH domain